MKKGGKGESRREVNKKKDSAALHSGFPLRRCGVALELRRYGVPMVAI